MRWIALDIDGTITHKKDSCPQELSNYLASLQKKGWQIIVLTGRSVSFSEKVLSGFSFPFFFSAQNGSILLEMPEKKILEKTYLNLEEILFVIKIAEKNKVPLIVYAGMERGDAAFYDKENLSEEDRRYVEDLSLREKKPWRSFLEMDIEEAPFLKAFGNEKEITNLEEALQKEGRFHLFSVKDPFKENTYLLQVTKKGCNKGSCLKRFLEKKGKDLVIAAGDDLNDIPLLQEADIKIAMEHAPPLLQEKADYIASSPEKEGLVPTLQKIISGL